MALLKNFILFLICTSFHLKVGATSISQENDICDNKEHPKILQKAFAEYSKDINILCTQYESASASLKKSRLEYKKFSESVSNKGLNSVFYLPKNKSESFLWAEKHVTKNFRGEEICWAAGMAQVLRTLETNQNSAEWCFLNTYSSSDNSLCFKEIEDQLISEKTITLNFIASAEVLVKDKFKNRKFVKYCNKDYKYDHETDTLLPLEPEYSSLLSDFNRLNWSNPYVVLSRSAEYRGYYNDFKTFIIPNLFSADTSVEQNRILNSIEYSKKIINDSILKITQLSATLREAAESYNLGYSSHEDYLFAKKMGLRNPDELSIYRLSANLKIPKADLINLFSLGINSYEKILRSAEEAKIIGYTSNIDFQKVLQFELDKKYSVENNISILSIKRDRDIKIAEDQRISVLQKDIQNNAAIACHKLILQNYDSARQDGFGRWSGTAIDLSRDFRQEDLRISSTFLGRPVLLFYGRSIPLDEKGYWKSNLSRSVYFHCVYDPKTSNVVHIERARNY